MFSLYIICSLAIEYIIYSEKIIYRENIFSGVEGSRCARASDELMFSILGV